MSSTQTTVSAAAVSPRVEASQPSGLLGRKHFPAKLECTGQTDSLLPNSNSDTYSSSSEHTVSDMSPDESVTPPRQRSVSKGRSSSSPGREGQPAGTDSTPQPVAYTPPKSSWTDLDLSVLVALAAPVGNWLTGGDHLKNLFLVLLLIIYLHQLIQVPWELYQSARARRPHPSTLPYTPSNSAIDRQVRLAATELRRHELVYLTVSVASPFLGAMLLRYVLTNLSGAGTLSWFSTSLYVLATGIRPWSHLLARLRERTESLHDAIHYPSPTTQLVADTKLDTLISQIERLEEELATLKQTMAARDKVEEAYDDLNTALDDVERVVRRQDRKLDSTRTSQDARLSSLEKSISRLAHTKRAEKTHGAIAEQYAPYIDKAGPSSLFSLFFHFAYVFWSFVTLSFTIIPFALLSSPSKSPKPSPSPSYSPKKPIHSSNSLQRLETIPEDASEGFPDETISETDYEVDAKFQDQLVQSPVSIGEDDGAGLRGSDRARKRKPLRPRRAKTFVDVVHDVVTLPYHVAVSVLTAILPPVQKLFAA